MYHLYNSSKFASVDHKLDFKDVLIVPRQTSLQSRKDVKLTTTYTFKYSKHTWSGIPLMSANMDSVTDEKTFGLLKYAGWLSCFPKHMNKNFIKNFRDESRTLVHTDNYALSMGINDKDIHQMDYLLKKLQDSLLDPRFVCIDVANGYMDNVLKVCHDFRVKHPKITLIAGNVVTPHGLEGLVANGVDIVKVGIGGGGACTTRIKTGVGYPQLSAVMECSEIARELGVHIISDGGITCPGDVTKAFAGGADFVMMGSILSAHEESPGETIIENGKEYKLFYGMSSKKANEKYSGGLKSYRTSEGKVVKLKCKGSLVDTVLDIEGGIRSSCTYTNSKELKDLYSNANFIRVSSQHNNTLDSMVIGH